MRAPEIIKMIMTSDMIGMSNVMIGLESVVSVRGLWVYVLGIQALLYIHIARHTHCLTISVEGWEIVVKLMPGFYQCNSPETVVIEEGVLDGNINDVIMTSLLVVVLSSFLIL